MRRQAHERVAVGRDEVRRPPQFFDGEAVELRRHLGAAAEDAGDAGFLSEIVSHSASSSFGVVNMHLMLSCA